MNPSFATCFDGNPRVPSECIQTTNGAFHFKPSSLSLSFKLKIMSYYIEAEMGVA